MPVDVPLQLLASTAAGHVSSAAAAMAANIRWRVMIRPPGGHSQQDDPPRLDPRTYLEADQVDAARQVLGPERHLVVPRSAPIVSQQGPDQATGRVEHLEGHVSGKGQAERDDGGA